MRDLATKLAVALALLPWIALAQTVPPPAPPAATPTEVPTKPSMSPAMKAAIANVSREKTQPRVIVHPALIYPDSERALGHGGLVTIGGIVGVDGRLTETFVLNSQAGPVLNAAAYEAARTMLFAPATDAQGAAMSVTITFPFNFTAPPLIPGYVKKADAIYPDAERQAGHFGKVVIGGRLGTDGRLGEAAVRVSSRAPALDAIALAAAQASNFQPFRDSSGAAVVAIVDVPFSFDSIHTPGKRGGLLQYRCAQFVLDETWWRSVWPASVHSELYALLRGMRSAAMLQGNAAPEPSGATSADGDFDARWTAALAACRAHPETLMIDELKPEGDLAKTMAARSR